MVEAGQTGALAANADSGNVLSGKTWDLVPYNWRRGASVQVACIAALAASVNSTVSLKCGMRTVADKTAVPYDSVARSVKMSDDVVITAWAAPGEKLYLNFNGGAAGAAAPGINWRMIIDPI